MGSSFAATVAGGSASRSGLVGSSSFAATVAGIQPSRLSVCGIYPSKSCLHRSASSLLRVLSGEFPAFSGTIGRLRLLTAIPPHFVSFAWQYLASHRVSRSSARCSLMPTLDHLLRGARAALSQRASEPSQVPGQPLRVHALLSDPGGEREPDPLSSHPVAFRCVHRVGPTSRLSWLNHTACTPPVYASQPGSPSVHATLGSGGGSALPVRDLHPTGCIERFTVVSYPRYFFLLSQALPGAQTHTNRVASL